MSSIKTSLMPVKIRNLQTRVIKEKGGTYAIACSALGGYSVGKTLEEAKKSFAQALDLHLSVLAVDGNARLTTELRKCY